MKYLYMVSLVFAVGCASHGSSTNVNKGSNGDHAGNAVVASPAPVVKPTVTDTSSEMPKLTCSKDSESRSLEVIKVEKGCHLDYAKFGKTATVASSVNGTQHCENSQKKIREKLEKAGYHCL